MNANHTLPPGNNDSRQSLGKMKCAWHEGQAYSNAQQSISHAWKPDQMAACIREVYMVLAYNTQNTRWLWAELLEGSSLLLYAPSQVLETE